MTGEKAAADRIVRELSIRNRRGLHARAAAKFVKLAGAFDAAIEVTRNDMVVNGQSIMGLMMLAASPGCTITVAATGPDADMAIEALATLVENRFDEE